MGKTKSQHTKIQLSCRVSPLVRSLITLERDKGSWESDGEAIEALVLRSSTSAEAYQLMLAEADKDPFFAALRNAMAANQPVASPRDDAAKTAKLVKLPKARHPEAPVPEP